MKKTVGALVFVVLIFGLSILAELGLDYIFLVKGLVEPNMIYGSLRDFLIYILLITLAILFLNKQNKKLTKNRMQLTTQNLVVVLLITLFYRVAEDPLLRFEILTGIEVFPDVSKYEYGCFQTLMLFLNFIILSSILEELVFRRIVLGYFFSNKVVLGVLFSSFVFTIKHILTGSSNLDYIELFAIFIFGVFTAVVYIRFGFFYAILFHSLYNFIWLIIGLNINSYWDILQELNFGTLYWIFVLTSVAILIFLLLAKKKVGYLLGKN